MNSTLRLCQHLLSYRLAHATGLSRRLPVNLTVSVTYRCPSRCKTCHIWQKTAAEMNLDEYAKTFRSLRRTPIWVTLSGGDQFIRSDLVDIVRLVRAELQPKIINIPMNGMATKRIFDLLPPIAEATLGGQLILNLSVDEIGTRHDELRGATGNFAKLEETAELVHDLKKTYDHVFLGVHTVVSRYNVGRVSEIAADVRARFKPDSYITEMAENREELGTIGEDIAPDPSDYRHATIRLKQAIRSSRSRHPVTRMVESLRLEYYDVAGRIVEQQRQVIDCYAGWSSGHLAPDGEVWGCCVRAESLGNVRDFGYDFGKVWFGPEADAFRASVRQGSCACPLANAGYTNLLLDLPSLLRVFAHFAGAPWSN